MTVCSGQSTIAAVTKTYAVSVVRNGSDQSGAAARVFNWSVKLFDDARVFASVDFRGTREMAAIHTLHEHPSMPGPCKTMLESLVKMRADEGEDVEATVRFVK